MLLRLWWPYHDNFFVAPVVKFSIDGSTFDKNTAGPVRGPLQAAPPPPFFPSSSSALTPSSTFTSYGVPAPTNPRSPFRRLSSSWAVPSLFVSPAQAAVQGVEEEEEELLLAPAPTSNKDDNTVAGPNAAMSTTTPASGQTGDEPTAEGVDDDSSTLEELRGRLRWLDKVTADAQQELDNIAPPPLKSALESVVKAAKETDVQPALDVTKRALDDLQEGFSGLYSSAKEFDAATATAQLKAKMEKELETRKEIEDAVAAAAAAAAAEKVTADEATLSSGQQQLPGAAEAVVPPAPSPPPAN